ARARPPLRGCRARGLSLGGARGGGALGGGGAGAGGGGGGPRGPPPAAAAIPAVLSGLWLVGHRVGLFSAEVGLALLSVGNILVFAAVLAFAARSLNRADRRRLTGERRLATQYATTRSLVESRTSAQTLPP